jgi:hypothetical protein
VRAQHQYAIRSPREPKVTGETQVAPVLERRRFDEFAHSGRERDVPGRAVIVGRYEVIALQNANSPIGGAFTPAWDPRQRLLGGLAEGGTGIQRQRAG